MNKISNYFARLLIFLIYLSFFFGFFNYEDAAGGGKIDLDHIYHIFQLLKNNNFFNIPWGQCDSISLPLYYLVTKYLIPFNDIFLFKLFTFFLSLYSISFFYKILNDWKLKCTECCYDRLEENSYAGQKYLDNWSLLPKDLAVVEPQLSMISPWDNVKKF